MKILIVSDSHGDIKSIQSAVDKEGLDEKDIIVHAGDYGRDIKSVQTKAKTYSVKGNCDNPVCLEPNSKLFSADGVRVYVAHGHLHGVKRSLSGLINEALSLGADMCVFGHTHIPFIENCGGALFVNPGTVNIRKSYASAASYAVVTIDGKEGITGAGIKYL